MTKRDQPAAERFHPDRFDPKQFAPATFDAMPSREEEIEALLAPVPEDVRDDDSTGFEPVELPAGSRSLADITPSTERNDVGADNPDEPKLSRVELTLYRQSLADLVEAERAAGANQLQFD